MCKDNKENLKKTNPFFEAYKTPHDTVPFDRIKLEHYEEAFMEGIRRDDEEIEKIINDPEEPTFENTIIRVDNETENIIMTSSTECPTCSHACSAPKPTMRSTSWRRR